MAVFLEEIAGLWTDGLEVGLIPLHVFVLRFDLGVYFWRGHAGVEEGRGASGRINNDLQTINLE